MKVLGTLGTSKEWGLQQFFPHLLDVIIFFFSEEQLVGQELQRTRFWGRTAEWLSGVHGLPTRGLDPSRVSHLVPSLPKGAPTSLDFAQNPASLLRPLQSKVTYSLHPGSSLNQS